MSDFPAVTSGAVALIQRGTCAFTLKLQNAVEAGAVGVILFNEGDSAGRSNALFRSADPGYTIPAVLSSFAVGEELYTLYKSEPEPDRQPRHQRRRRRDALPERRRGDQAR